MIDGCRTTNLAISIYTHAELKPREDDKVTLAIQDLEYEKSFENLDQALACTDEQIRLIQKHLEFWRPKQGFELSTRSESPIGAGLGGSSSLCISLIKVFSQWLAKTKNVYEMVELAHNLEAQALKKPTGTQDYFPAIHGGMNSIFYGPEGAKVATLQFPVEVFRKHLILVYTGVPHFSGLNNWQVIKAVIDGDAHTLKALKSIRDIAFRVNEACARGEWNRMAALFRDEFEARKDLSPGFSSPEIERLKTHALEMGAEAVKICGAGGGGCVFLWAEESKHELLKKSCREMGFRVLPAEPVL